MTWFDVFQGQLLSHEFDCPCSGLQLVFFPRSSYNWFAFFRPAYTAFQPFRDKILTYVEQQYVEELFYMPCWFSHVLCIAIVSQESGFSNQGEPDSCAGCLSQWITLRQWSLCDHPLQNPQWFECSSWTHLFITWRWFFPLFLVAVGREDLLQEAVQTDLAAVTCSSEKFYLKLLDCPVHICVKQMLFRTSRSCLTMLELMPACQYILSCGEKALFMRLELSWGWASPLCTGLRVIKAD